MTPADPMKNHGLVDEYITRDTSTKIVVRGPLLVRTGISLEIITPYSKTIMVFHFSIVILVEVYSIYIYLPTLLKLIARMA